MLFQDKCLQADRSPDPHRWRGPPGSLQSSYSGSDVYAWTTLFWFCVLILHSAPSKLHRFDEVAALLRECQRLVSLVSLSTYSLFIDRHQFLCDGWIFLEVFNNWLRPTVFFRCHLAKRANRSVQQIHSGVHLIFRTWEPVGGSSFPTTSSSPWRVARPISAARLTTEPQRPQRSQRCDLFDMFRPLSVSKAR